MPARLVGRIEMRILFVAMSNSIHSVRWISQLVDQGWDIYLYPSQDIEELHEGFLGMRINLHKKLRKRRFKLNWCLGVIIRKTKKFFFANDESLYKYIEKIKPDIIHTLETQAAGYKILQIKNSYYGRKPFPIWVHSVWGSDLYLFGRMDEHKERIIGVMSNCNYFISESKRDISLAKKYGYNGQILPIMQATGGFEVDKSQALCKRILPSKRRAIILKGYQNWAGRALVGLKALELCSKLLKNYLVIIILPNPDVDLAAKLFSEKFKVKIDIIKNGTSHTEMLKAYGRARVFIGLSISDGVPNSLLEAMLMGAFPIQSDTSCANEWIEHGRNGFLVTPEDPWEIARAIKMSLKNDVLVDNAARCNLNKIKRRMSYKDVKDKAISSYVKIFETGKTPREVNEFLVK